MLQKHSASWEIAYEEIDFRGKSERIGDALVEQVGTAVGEARKAAIGELVGYVFGGLTKSWLGA